MTPASSHRPTMSDPAAHRPTVATFGATYVYPGAEGDAGTRDPGSGGIRFISFAPGGTSGAAAPGPRGGGASGFIAWPRGARAGAATDERMDHIGGWKVRLTIPGPTFTYQDASGA